MKITIKHYGVKYSIKTKQDDLHAIELIQNFTNLMLCAGWHQESIDSGIMQLNEQNK